MGLGVLLAASALGSACTMKSQEAPPLTGPSEFGLSVTVTASPDVLTQDGASRSLVTITARDDKGKAKPNVSLRAEISVGGVRADFGSLSARNLVTDGGGVATLVYTAPAASEGGAVDTGTVVDILITPIGNDYGNTTWRQVAIRLVPPGIVVPPDGLAPYFTASTSNPTDHQTVLFTACGDPTRSCAPSNNPVAGYAWDFGDGATATGPTVSHSYTSPGSFFVKLTISDAIGRSASTTQTMNVIQGNAPSAAFTFSPSNPQANQVVNFNAAASTPATGRRIVSYAWDFGDGDQKTSSSPTTTHDFVSIGSFLVTLTVTDDAGYTGTTSNTVVIGSFNEPTANFTMSPTDPVPGQSVSFNASSSRAQPGRTIVSYTWDFGDGSPLVTTSQTIINHTYATENTFTITLTVTDDQGTKGSKSQTLPVKFPS